MLRKERDNCVREKLTLTTHVDFYSLLRRFPLDARAVSAKKKVTEVNTHGTEIF